MNGADDQLIISLFGSVPYFADTPIESMCHEEAKRPFVRLYSWCHEGAVNMQRVAGTTHPDYAGLTWRELLHRGRRMDANLKLFRTNPEYYTAYFHRIPSLHISFVDGKGYVGEDGNHRTCIGRFYLYHQSTPYMYGIRVSEQYTDFRMMALYARLVGLLPEGCTVTPCSREVRRDDGDGWASHEFTLSLRVHNRRRNQEAEFSADELETSLIPALYSPFRRFGMYRNLLS